MGMFLPEARIGWQTMTLGGSLGDMGDMGVRSHSSPQRSTHAMQILATLPQMRLHLRDWQHHRLQCMAAGIDRRSQSHL